MRDEYDMRLWVEHHDAFGEFIGRVVETVRVSLARLYAIEFEAPWKRQNDRLI